MGVILLPNGMPGTRVRETLTKDEIKVVTEFERWATRRGLVLDLICKHCLDEGRGGDSRCIGDNARDASSYKISCAHAERVYGA